MSEPPAQQWHLTETYKGLIVLAVETLKMLALVNGGAAIAVLTYLGNLATRSSSAPHSLPNIKPALLCYSGGLVATVAAFVVAYVTQLWLYNEEISRAGETPLKRRHHHGVNVCLFLALSASIAFGVGCYLAAGALIS